jgi:hypothetical protein
MRRTSALGLIVVTACLAAVSILLSIPTTSSAQARPAKQKWEYKVVAIYSSKEDNHKDWETTLNKLGEEEWEVVEITHWYYGGGFPNPADYRVVLKRAK